MPKAETKFEAIANDKILQAVLSYKDIKEKMETLEKELRTHKKVLEAAASETENGVISVHGHKVTLSLGERENFSLKQAKAALGEDVLKQFISKTLYTSLRVS